MELCLNEKKHTLTPIGYFEWHEWADKKGKKHHQVKCKGCGLYKIWVRTSNTRNDKEDEDGR